MTRAATIAEAAAVLFIAGGLIAMSVWNQIGIRELRRDLDGLRPGIAEPRWRGGDPPYSLDAMTVSGEGTITFEAQCSPGQGYRIGPGGATRFDVKAGLPFWVCSKGHALVMGSDMVAKKIATPARLVTSPAMALTLIE